MRGARGVARQLCTTDDAEARLHGRLVSSTRLRSDWRLRKLKIDLGQDLGKCEQRACLVRARLSDHVRRWTAHPGCTDRECLRRASISVATTRIASRDRVRVCSDPAQIDEDEIEHALWAISVRRRRRKDSSRHRRTAGGSLMESARGVHLECPVRHVRVGDRGIEVAWNGKYGP